MFILIYADSYFITPTLPMHKSHADADAFIYVITLLPCADISSPAIYASDALSTLCAISLC